MKKNSKKGSRKNTRRNIVDLTTIPEIISNKFLNEANTVVNELIEKIISLSISTNFNSKIESNIPSACFDYLRNTVDSYLSLNFISHDKEEINKNNFSLISKNNQDIIANIEPILNEDNIKNNISLTEPSFEEQKYFNNYTHGENNWDLIDEPLSNKYDRYATTLVKLKEIEKEKNKFNKNDKEILEEIDEENDNISLNENNNKKEEGKEILEKYATAIRKRTTKILSNIFNYDINNNNKNKKKNLNEIMSQFSYHDLEDDNDIYKEPTNINYEKLRKEVQLKQNEENEEKKNQKNIRRDVENKMKLAVEKNRQYNGKKITVDSNGEIVFIKGIKLDKLSKEFLLMKTNTKLIKDEEKEKENEKNKSKKKKKKGDNIYGFNLNNNSNNEDDKKKEKEKSIEKNNNDNINDKNDEIIGEKAIKGRNQKLPKIKGGKFRSRENPDDIYKSKILRRIEEGPIILSGSNFEIMNMEVGVSIKEKEKYKTGGKDFYHKFHKYSLDNYNKQLKDTLQINSFYKSQMDNENYTKSDFNNYLGNLTEAYNSSINFANNNSNLNNQQTNNSNKNFLTNYNTLSNFDTSSLLKSKKINASLIPELKLSGTQLSLKGSMDKLNLISERQEKLAQKVKNIFKKRVFNYTSNKFKLPKLEEINKFSSEILTSSNWMHKKGVNNMIGKPSRKPEKPGFQEIIREMGVNGKIFRDRNKTRTQTQNNIDEKVKI